MVTWFGSRLEVPSYVAKSLLKILSLVTWFGFHFPGPHIAIEPY
ncbi:hypothetical protein FM102_04940 [Corynebacterium glutamicum]|nr:hypothetical protein FM102_04940 [Corynebacterium glutamicum]